MKLRTHDDVETFREAVRACGGDVWLRNADSRYNLKSALSFMVAIGRVIAGDESLELFADDRRDEARLLGMFAANPAML